MPYTPGRRVLVLTHTGREDAISAALQATRMFAEEGLVTVMLEQDVAAIRAAAGDPPEFAPETLGVDWKKTLPIPKTSAERFPEVKKLLELGLQSKQYSFSLDNLSEAGKIFQGVSPSGDGTMLTADEQTPQGYPMTIGVERMEEFAPGLDTDLLALLQATAEMEMADVQMSFGPVSPEGEAPLPGNDGTGLVDKVKNAIS